VKGCINSAAKNVEYQTLHDEKGFFAKRTFIEIFRRPGGVGVVWKQKFTKQAGEYVAEIFVVELEGRYLVDHALVW
jgi:hypothetical protein